jgi:hypothetical protein
MSDQGQGRKRSSVLSAPKGEGGRGDEGQSLPSLRQALEARLEEAQILRFVHHA